VIAFLRNFFEQKPEGKPMADFTPLTALITELSGKVDAEMAKRVAAETSLATALASLQIVPAPAPVTDDQPSVDAAIVAVNAVLAKFPA
jgi:hypothetical protein